MTTVHFRFQCEKLKIDLVAYYFCFFFNFQLRTVTSGDNKKIAENFNAVSLILKRTEQCKVSM